MTRIAVVGAGIGGLAASLAFARQGLQAIVYEQAAMLGEVGAGVQVSPNANRVLSALGLGDAMAAIGCRPEATELRHYRSGEVIASRPLGAAAEARYGAPYMQVLRSDLHRILAEAQPPGVVRLGRRLRGFEGGAEGVVLAFDDGSTETADLLVGADGVRSAVRARLLGPEAPVFRGEVAYRGVVPAALAGAVAAAGAVWIGPGRHFVAYPVARGRLVNCLGIVKVDSWREESWSTRASTEEWLAAFDGWPSEVTDLIAAVPEPYKWALYDREPSPRWSFGPVTLMGDAAHPMLPSMAQGAAMAIEDGFVLAACVAASPGADGLARYETLRRERTGRVQRQSRDNQALAFLPYDLDGAELRAAMARQPVSHDDLFDWLYGYDATRAAA